MELVQIRENIKSILKPPRYLHSIGVEEVACDLAAINGYDMEKASIAGILHDCAKNLTDPELLDECSKYGLPVSETEKKCIFLLHAKVGALHARIKYGIEDEDILNAITFHTTGRPAMTLLEKIIFTADYIEPYRRQLPQIDLIRKTAYSELDLGVYMILKNTLNYLRDTSAVIDSLTEDTLKYYEAVLQTQH